MKLRQMMFMKIFKKTGVCLIFVIILKIHDFMILSIKKWLVKWKMKLGERISEFVGLKLNMYSLVMIDGGEIRKAKSVNTNVVDSIMHTEYVDKLFSRGLVRHKMKRIQSKLHRTGTFDVYKISFSCFDDKRYIFDDGVSSLAYFHKDVLV